MKTVVVDQSGWGRLRVSGADRVRFLQGMLTNDVAAVERFGWIRAAVLTPKARVVAVCDVTALDDAFLLVTEPSTADKLLQVLQKHAIMDEVEFTPVDVPVHRVWPDPESVWTAPPVLAAPPGPPSSHEEVEIRRVEAGFPRYGVDVSEDYFPFEANLDRAISYGKGCYIGQEPVARAQARGQANKRLMGLQLAGAGAVASGSPLSHPSRPDAGKVTSSVVSPDFGPIALAYVHKTVWNPGTVLDAAGRQATVCALPLAKR